MGYAYVQVFAKPRVPLDPVAKEVKLTVLESIAELIEEFKLQ